MNSYNLFSQNLSNKGKEFWVGYGHHQFMEPENDNSQEMVLYFSAEEAAHVTVTINGTTFIKEYDVPANTVISSELIPKGIKSSHASVYDARLYTAPPSYDGTGSEGVFPKKGIHIVSDVPIVAYAHIYGSLSSGATLLMPVETWGYSYVSLNTRQYYQANYDCFSWMYVVARQNNTRIMVVPSVNTRNGHVAGVAFPVDLQKGEIFQMVGASIDAQQGEDLTGTSIQSIANDQGTCYPIAVFSGSSRTSITCDLSVGSGDNIMQQIFPYQAWGKRYLTAPTSVDNNPAQKNLNIYRVVVKDPNTIVKKNGQQIFGISKDIYYEIPSDEADLIEADKPILVAQYIPSANACNYQGNGDPEMIYLSPIEQSIKHVGFYRNTKENIEVNYLTLIIPTEGLKSLKIDGANSYNLAYEHPHLKGYSVVVKRWKAAEAQCIVESDSAFTAITYGLGGAESYGYNAGTNINNLSGLPEINNEYNTTGKVNKTTCAGAPVKLSVLMRYQPTSMVWKLSELDGTISPATDVTVNAPAYSGTELVNGVTYYRYSLPQSYTFKTSGFIDVPLITSHPSVETCDHSEPIAYRVQVLPALKTDFDIVYNNCMASELIAFNAKEKFANDSLISQWKWTFSDGTTQAGQKITKQFATGQCSARLMAISTDGCVADTSKNFSLADKPATPDFDITSSSLLCEGNKVVFTEKKPEAGIKKWYWDFDKKDTATALNGDPQTKIFNTTGSYKLKHVVKFSDVCISDTAYLDITIYANPVLGISYPAACLGADGKVQFTSTTTIADGQSLANYAWDFGDADATAANPNTSAAVNPVHSFSKGTQYGIHYAVTTDKGCKKDSTIKITFSIKPQLTFGPLADVCENVEKLSIAKASVTNGVSGSGFYYGAGVDAAGSFSPSAAGKGNHDIWYVFTSKNGCQDSIKQTITVHPKPAANFDISEEICIEQSAIITDKSAIDPVGTISSWRWNFGDGESAVYNNGNVFNQPYTASGNFTVKLVTISNKGCSDTATNTITVHPKPIVDFSLPDVVCMPEGAATFTNLSSAPDNMPLRYDWDFGDNGIATEISPKHIYAKKGPYAVTLKVSGGGCLVTTSKSLQAGAFYDSPVADFNVTPQAVCQGNDNTFTDLSKPADGSISSWSWNFNDGTTTDKRNPVKRYVQAGDYNVELIVTSKAGCASMPASKPVKIFEQPVIEAGASQIVPQGTVVQFKATASNPAAQSFSWSPASLLSAPATLTPSYTAMQDQIFVLTATSAEGNCTATDELTIKILKPVKVPNVFSPNGDGINDRWEIANLSDYAGATVEVFNRYGQMVYRSAGYNVPWDGNTNGNQLPVGAYYYVIQLKNGFQPLTGSITILR